MGADERFYNKGLNLLGFWANILIICGKWLNTVIPVMYGPFPFLVRCIVGRFRSALFLVLYW
jgi:hypothetical protein